MNAQTVADIICISVAAFVGFEIALGLNYLALNYLLRAMRAGVRKRPDAKAPEGKSRHEMAAFVPSGPG